MEIYYRRLSEEPPYPCDDVTDCSPKDGKGSKSNLPFSPILLSVICVLAAIFFLISYLVVLKKYRFNLSSIRRSVSTTNALDRTDEEDTTMNEDHRPELIHPIWFIKTVGLQQKVIDSIAIVKYKKGEGLIEGTDCSICLSEFEEDESLRLLSKCSHAFHISCIDTWLTSHKNCPLCRAPIVADTSNVDSSTEEMNIAEVNTSQDDSVETGESQRHQVGEDHNLDDNSGSTESTSIEEAIVEKSLSSISVSNHHTEVQADKSGEKEGGSQQVRRSVSLDSSLASAIHIAVANIDPMKAVNEGNYKSLSKIDEVIKGFSLRHYWEKGPISMNRTSSSSGKWPNPRSSRSHDSNL